MTEPETAPVNIRTRPGARIVLLTPEGRFLLFRFEFTEGPLAGREYWGLPGGGMDEGETPGECAKRELFEETGLSVDSVGDELASGGYPFRLISGERVVQWDHYFLLRVPEAFDPLPGNRTPEEKTCLAEARWWSPAELAAAGARAMPPDAAAIVSRLIGGENCGL